MLEELSKHDAEWKAMAIHICKDKYIADDLVNDMYLKLYDSGKTFQQINKWFVYVTMKNIYLNIIKRDKKSVSIDAFYSLSDFYTEDDRLDNRKMIVRALNEIGFFDREILMHTQERSLRKNEKYLGISKNIIYYNSKNALKKIKETKTIRNYGKDRQKD
jgi:DNA-directed RNA polymerase specialized sigma24 family protein